MKSVVIDNSKPIEEILDSQCYRRSNSPCSNSCPFYQHDPTSPMGDILLLVCNTYQTVIQVTGYTSP